VRGERANIVPREPVSPPPLAYVTRCATGSAQVSFSGAYCVARRPNVQATASRAVLISGGTRSQYRLKLPSGARVELTTSTATIGSSPGTLRRYSVP
jgi:hypothetical protein